jgi:hypothetical protein
MSEFKPKPLFKDEQATGNFLTAARTEMYTSLSLFQDHVKHLLSLMFTVLTATLAILGFIIEGKLPSAFDPTVVVLLGGSILLLMFLLGNISTIIISRYYRLYVSTLLYAADLHESRGLGSHVWFQDLTKERSESESPGDCVKKRAYGWPHSWRLYAILIWILSNVSLISGALVILWALHLLSALLIWIVLIACLIVGGLAIYGTLDLLYNSDRKTQ